MSGEHPEHAATGLDHQDPDHRDRARRRQPRADRPVSAEGHPEREAACEALVARYQSLVRACVQRHRESPESAES